MENKRGFSSRFGFIMSMAAFSIGIGNVWKFPYVVGNNGGGAFLLMYILIVLLVGIPGLLRAELLPYNPMAGAKYPQLGMKGPEFTGPKADERLLEPFVRVGVPAILA